MKVMTIIMGASGSGKSTLATALGSESNHDSAVFEADTWFEWYNAGKFNPECLDQAHYWCKTQVLNAAHAQIRHIIISNTNTTMKEIKPYLQIAELFGYTVQRIAILDRPFKSVHNVPQETIRHQAARLYNLVKSICDSKMEN